MKLHSLAIATLVSTLCLSGTTLWAKTGTENLNVTYNNTKIYLKDAYDFFKLVVPKDGVLSLSAQGAVDLGLQIDLYGKDGATRLNSSSGKNQVVNLSTAVQKGTYYVRVNGYSGSGDYSLTNSLSVQGIGNDVEPNDSYQNAIVHKLGAATTGHIGYYNDSNKCDKYDWYKVNLSTTQDLKVILDATQDVGVQIDLYASDAANRLSSTSGKNQQLRLTKRLSSGTYYVRVSSYSGAGGYTLIIK